MGGEVNGKRNSDHKGVPKEAGTKNVNANSFIQEWGNAGQQKKLKWLHQKTGKQHRIYTECGKWGKLHKRNTINSELSGKQKLRIKIADKQKTIEML